MVFAGILAGGLGTSMHRGDLPKQFLLLGSKPILIHTLEQFLINSHIDRIIVVAPQDWIMYTRDLIKKYLGDLDNVEVIAGGNNKNQSIKKIVLHLDANYDVKGEDILINHDAIRPLVTQRIIDENVEAARKYGAVNTVMPTVDTIVESGDAREIGKILEKPKMYFEQTPQTSTIGVLKRTMEVMTEEQQDRESETSRLILNSGQRVFMVEGEYANIKIVTSYDFQIANALVKGLNNSATQDI